MVLILFGLIALSQLQLNWYLLNVKAIWPVLLVTFLLNAVTYPGEILLSVGPVAVTLAGISLGLMMSTRIALLVLLTSLFSFTTSPMQLTGALERMFRPFGKLGLPAGELALMMTIALRFIPTIVEEGERLLRASQARGGNLSAGNLIQRARALTPLLIPLFLGAFRRADDLALAMEARAYRSGTARTSFRPLQFAKQDYWVLAASTAAILALVGSRL